MATPLALNALVVGGCSDGGGEDAAEEATTTTGPFEPTLRIVPDQPAAAAQLDALAELATARLVGAGAGRARTEIDGGAVLVDVGRSPLSDSTAAELLDAPGVVGFQPVLEVRPFDQCPDGGEDDLAPEVDDGGLTVACHLLGPPALDESAVERAEVADGSGGVSAVAVLLSEGEDGIEFSTARPAPASLARRPARSSNWPSSSTGESCPHPRSRRRASSGTRSGSAATSMRTASAVWPAFSPAGGFLCR